MQSDILSSTLHANKKSLSSESNSRTDTNMTLNLKSNSIESRLLQSKHANRKSSDKNGRPLSSVDASEFNNHNSEVKNPLIDLKDSSHVETYPKLGTSFIQEESEPPIWTVFNRSEDLSFESNDRDSDSRVLSNYSTSKLELQSEKMVIKSQLLANSLNEIQISNKPFLGPKEQNHVNLMRHQITSEVPTSEKTHQVDTKDSKLETYDKIKDSGSDNSIQEDFSFKSSGSENRFVNSNSISANSETAFSSNAGNLQNTSFLSQKHRKKGVSPKNSTNKVSSKLISKTLGGPTETPTSNANINMHTVHSNIKKVTELKISQDSSFVLEPSHSNVSSSAESSIGSHGLFKLGPYKILTIEDLVAANEVQKFQEEEDDASSDVENGMEDIRQNKPMQINGENINKDTGEKILSESEQNTILEPEEIEEEIRSEISDDLSDGNHTSNSDSLLKTNSSYREMMNQLSSHSEIKNYQVLRKETNVPSEQISINSMSLSPPIVSNKSKQEASDNEDVHNISSAVKSKSKDKTLPTEHGSYAPLSAQSSHPLDSLESTSLSSNSSKTNMKPLRSIKYSSIGIQTENNIVYHPVLYAKSVQQSSSAQPMMHTDAGESHSPVYRYYSRLMEFQGKTTPVDIALSEILRHQIELTRHFINSQQNMYQAYCTSVVNMSADYKPVTLQDTRKYIRSHLKNRRTLRKDLDE